MPRGVQLRELELKQKMAAKRLQRFFRAMKSSKAGRAARVKKSRASFQKYNLHRFHRFGDALTLDVSSTTSINGMQFQLNQVRGYADFADLYDRYMITCVVVKFRLINNPDATWVINGPTAGALANPSNWFPKLYYCPDYDDSSSETLNQLKERAQTKLKILRPNQFVTVVVKPAVTIQTYATATSTGYAPKWRQWIDMAQQDIPHYGLKYVVDCSGLDPNDTYPFKIEIERKYYIACKDVR